MRAIDVTGPVAAVAFSPDGATLACGSKKGVQLCDPTAGVVRLTVLSVARLPPGPPLLFAADGRWVAFNALRFDLAGAAHMQPGGTLGLGALPYLQAPGYGRSGRLAYDRDLSLCVRLDGDWLRVYTLPDGQEVRRIANAPPTRIPDRWAPLCESLSLTPDGRTAAAAFLSRSVFLFDVAAGRVAARFDHTDEVWCVGLSPDGRVLATATSGRVVRLWDVPGRREIARFKAFRKKVRALVFSPDGRLLLGGSDDGTVRLWDVAGGQEVARYDWGVGAVTALAFAPDGRRAAAGGVASAVVWDVDL
jgi:WD40 repeat protein